MKRRINISLSDEAVRLFNRMAPKGDCNRFLGNLEKRGARARARLRARLTEGAIKRAQHDREIAFEWDPPADEIWQRDVRRWLSEMVRRPVGALRPHRRLLKSTRSGPLKSGRTGWPYRSHRSTVPLPTDRGSIQPVLCKLSHSDNYHFLDLTLFISYQQIAAHESPRTTKLYDRTTDQVSLDEIEWIAI